MQMKQLIVLALVLNANQSYELNLKVKNKIQNVSAALWKVLSFMEMYYSEINLDGALGITLTIAQLEEIRDDKGYSNQDVPILIRRYKKLLNEIIRLLPEATLKDFLYIYILLDPKFWRKSSNFSSGVLRNLGHYNWTSDYILKNKKAEYNGVPTDFCMYELLSKTLGNRLKKCKPSTFCDEMMFGRRIDHGYLLTHRLLYLQIAAQLGCYKSFFKKTRADYCTYILKEAKTNSILGFPQRDIFLEQVALCGMEGFEEFFDAEWMDEVLSWQTKEGCHKRGPELTNETFREDRSANYIAFGCTDHTTGLASAVLAIYLKYIFKTMF